MQDILGYKHEESACILAIEENEVSKLMLLISARSQHRQGSAYLHHRGMGLLERHGVERKLVQIILQELQL